MRYEDTIQFFKDMDKIIGSDFSKDISKSRESKGGMETFTIFTASNSFITFHKATSYRGGHASSLTWGIEYYDRRKKETVVGDIDFKCSYIEAVARIMWNLINSEDLQKLYDTDPKFYRVYYFNNKTKIRDLDKKYYLAKHKEITVTAKELKILKILYDNWKKEGSYSYGMTEYSVRHALKQKTFPHKPMWYLLSKDLVYIREEEVFKAGKLDKFYNISYNGTDILRKKGLVEPRKK